LADAARYSSGIPSTISTTAAPRTSSTLGGKPSVSIVMATRGLAVIAAATLLDTHPDVI
jgi:hypothetical protein